jgi:hypothetical protein
VSMILSASPGSSYRRSNNCRLGVQSERELISSSLRSLCCRIRPPGRHRERFAQSPFVQRDFECRRLWGSSGPLPRPREKQLLFMLHRWGPREVSNGFRQVKERLRKGSLPGPRGPRTPLRRPLLSRMLVSPSECGPPIQLSLAATLRERVLLLSQFSAPCPSFRHAPPHLLVLWIA